MLINRCSERGIDGKLEKYIDSAFTHQPVSRSGHTSDLYLFRVPVQSRPELTY